MAKRKQSRIRQTVRNAAKSAKTILDPQLPLNAMSGKGIANEAMKNGLGEAFGYPGSFPFNQGTPFSEQVSNITSMFKNLRWYLVSNLRQVLSQAYIEIGLIQTIVDVPVDDGLRGGVEIKSKQLDENQIEELQVSLDRDDDLNTAGQAAKWNRLFGGAGIIIMTDQDPETPLDIESISKDSPLEFRAVDMWELFWDKQNTEGYDPQIQAEDIEFYSYYGIKLHKSRVMRLKGLTAPSFIRPRLRGWGFSVVEALVRSINQYLKGTDLGYEVLDEFKIDVFRVKNLNNTLLSPNGNQKVRERFQMVNWIKNYNNALVLDIEDEYDHKQLSFAGLGEAMDGIRLQIAADMRMPITKLFGTSMSKGFATDQNDMEVYNAMVESQVRNKLKYDILRIIEIKCQKLFGFIPDDIAINFKPLRILSAEQEENVKTQKFNRLLSAKQAGEITVYEFREGVNKGNLFDIKLDNAGDKLNSDDPDVANLVAGQPDPAEESQDQGSYSEDTEKSGDEKKHNAINPNQLIAHLKPFTANQAIERAFKNTAEFDRKAYETEGGDNWIRSDLREVFMNHAHVDDELWMRSKKASMNACGKVKWKFVTWWYKKHGGEFNERANHMVAWNHSRGNREASHLEGA